MKRCIAVFLLATAMHAQTAKVIALDSKDAAEAKSLHDQQEALDAKTKAFREAVSLKYLRLPINKYGCIDRANTVCSGWYRDGWGFGDFLYSEDFKYIVPAPVPQVSAWKYGDCIISTSTASSATLEGGSHAN